MLKRMCKIVALVLCFALIYALVDGLLSTKAPDGIGTLEKYYALPEDTVDVLFVGSSHIGMNLDPSLLMDDYGIASYALWGGMQSVWNSYYYLKEGLKSQTPKVAVAEVFLCGVDNEYADTASALKGILAMHPSLDKVRLALASFPTWQQAAEAVWGMPTYHSRYDELVEDDYLALLPADTSIQQMDHNVTVVTPLEMPDYQLITTVHALAEKQELYLRKMIALCRSEDVPLVLLIAPFQASEDEAARLNRVEQIAEEEGVTCLNYLKTYRQEGIVPETDFYDVGHLNVQGIPKFTRSLARFLSKNFDLPDRREDPDHIWNVSAAEREQEDRDDGAVYRLEEVFTGDGSGRYVDTGVQPLENPYESWTILTRIDTRTYGDDEDRVYLSCFNEEEAKGFYGLLLKKEENGDLQLRLGNNESRSIPYSGDSVDIGIVKEGGVYTVYADGQPVVNGETLPTESYPGDLLLGCQELSADGEKFRFSRTRIPNLEYYDEALDEQTVRSWEPEELPEAPLPLGLDVKQPENVYTLPEQFVGGGDYAQDDHIDTGVRLLESEATRFTLLASFTPRPSQTDNVFLSCFAEEEGNYRGLLVRQLDDETLNVIVGSNYSVTAPLRVGEPVHLAIVKNGSRYTVYVDGVRVQETVDLPADAFDGTLLVGAQTDSDGRIFRASQTNVNSLTVMSGVMSRKDILDWPYEDAPMPEKPVETSVEYRLLGGFAGDGSENSVDTGVMLYDAPSKDWTLQAVVRTRQGVNAGVYFSCFCEEDNGYRGLMLRQDSADDITLYVGQLETHTMELNLDNRRMNLVLVKEGDVYTLYVNGSRITRIESPCARYLGTLLVGCQISPEGELFRFSDAKVDDLQLWDGAMDAEDALALSAQAEQTGRFGN